MPTTTVAPSARASTVVSASLNQTFTKLDATLADLTTMGAGNVPQAGIDLGHPGTLCASLVVGAKTGTLTLDVVIETSSDNGVADAWRPASPSGAFTQATVAGTERKTFTVDRWVRANPTVGGSGTPTATFTVKGDKAL